jgi:hypothetical protein
MRAAIAAAALCVASPVVAQELPFNRATDEFSLDFVPGTCDEAEVWYFNSDPPNSAGFPQELATTSIDCGPLTVELRLTIGPAEELIEVFAPEGWVVDPPYAHVLDGDDVTITLTRYVHQGM